MGHYIDRANPSAVDGRVREKTTERHVCDPGLAANLLALARDPTGTGC